MAIAGDLGGTLSRFVLALEQPATRRPTVLSELLEAASQALAGGEDHLDEIHLSGRRASDEDVEVRYYLSSCVLLEELHQGPSWSLLHFEGPSLQTHRLLYFDAPRDCQPIRFFGSFQS